MCKATVESAEGTGPGVRGRAEHRQGLNRGILLLMAVPYVLLFLLFRGAHRGLLPGVRNGERLIRGDRTGGRGHSGLQQARTDHSDLAEPVAAQRWSYPPHLVRRGESNPSRPGSIGSMPIWGDVWCDIDRHCGSAHGNCRRGGCTGCGGPPSLRYQRAWNERPAYLFITHNDVLYAGDIIGSLLTRIQGISPQGRWGNVKNCPAWSAKVCSPETIHALPTQLRRMDTAVDHAPWCARRSVQ